MNLNEQIEKLRSEAARPEAKGELILKLQQGKNQNRMKIISKLSISTACVALALVGGAIFIPRTALASPESVAKAIKEAQSYVIKSFRVTGETRHLMTKTTITDGNRTQVAYDNEGKEVAAPNIQVGGLDLGSALKITEGIPSGAGVSTIKIGGGELKADAKNRKISVETVKGPDGEAKTVYKVDGKVVDKLPAGVSVKSAEGATGLRISMGKEDFEFKESNKPMSTQGSLAIVGSAGNGGTFVSGQTSADYLQSLLADETKWTIERGVMVNGQKLDKFTMKGPFSPIELFVEPTTSLPKVLRFTTPNFEPGSDQKQLVIEDVYEYGRAPQK